MSDMTSSTGSAGALIRLAREEQNVSIDTLAATIKVPPAKLLALESDDRAVLPDANLNRALAMTVCRALKVDAAPILALMPAAVATSLASGKPPLNQPYRDFSHTGLTFERSSMLKLRVPSLPPAVLAPLVLLCLAAGIYFMPEHIELGSWLPSGVATSSPSGAPVASAVDVPVPVVIQASSADWMASEPVAGGAVQPAVVVASAVSAGASAAVTGAVVSVSPPASMASVALSTASAPRVATRAADAASASAVASVTMAGSAASSVVDGVPAKVTLSSKEAAWIEVRDAVGVKVFSRQLAAGERVDVQGRPPLKVLAGNAPSVSIQFNGKPVDLAAVTRQNVARIELK